VPEADLRSVREPIRENQPTNEGGETVGCWAGLVIVGQHTQAAKNKFSRRGKEEEGFHLDQKNDRGYVCGNRV